MFLKVSTALFLLLATIQASATIINANDYSVGTDVSNPDSNTTLSWIHSDGYKGTLGENGVVEYFPISNPGIEYKPVTIQSTKDVSVNYFSKATVNLNGALMNSNIGKSLDDLQPHRPFDSLLISYKSPTNHFEFKAAGGLGSGIHIGMFLFDENKQFIKWMDAASGIGNITGGVDAITYPRLNMEKSFDFDFDVSYILFGAWDSANYIYEINTSVPEPSPILLLLLGLAFILIKHGAFKCQESCRIKTNFR